MVVANALKASGFRILRKVEQVNSRIKRLRNPL